MSAVDGRDRRQERVDKARLERKRRERALLLGDDPHTGYEESAIALDMRMQTTMQGVTLTWLHYVFKRDRATAKMLLVDCPVLRHGAGGAPVYDPAVAAQYLVKPKMDIKKLLGTLKEGDLPDELKPKVWEARLKQQRWEEKAGNLWRAEAVLEVFGTTFKTMRDVMQLWADNIAEETTLSEDQRKLIVGRVDDLQAELHKSLLDLASKRKTPSQKDEPLAPVDDDE